MTPWDQRLARWLVRPLAATPVTPNQLTAASLALALWGAWEIASGEPARMAWGATWFVLGRFVDHFDGELARLTGRSSRLGYYLDYLAGGASYAALFAALGAGLARGELGAWALGLGAAGTAAALIAVFSNLRLDALEGTGEAVGYPGFAGFELEDGVYLLAPIAWAGWLAPFFVAAGVGAVVYTSWTFVELARRRARSGRGGTG